MAGRLIMFGIVRKWFPERPGLSDVKPALREFYRASSDYHDMTAAVNKTQHPQVKILQCLIQPGKTYAEIGCGAGQVSELVARQAYVHGFDVSPLAIEKAERGCGTESRARFHCARAQDVPLPDESMDGVFSFETLEHTWNPELAISEMKRITRPSGFILLSFPNRFSLDLHLDKNRVARALEWGLASVSLLACISTARLSLSVIPDIGGNVYPDCDMVTAIVPMNLIRFMKKRGCAIEFWDSTYMCAHREGSNTSIEFQRNTASPFLRNFGDHILLLARKGGVGQSSRGNHSGSH